MRWDDSMYVKAFRLSQQGKDDQAIARKLGLRVQHFAAILKRRPALRQAIDDGREAGGKGLDEFKEFVTGRLPKRARQVWDELVAAEKAWEEGGTNEERVYQIIDMIQNEGRRVRQQLYVHALLACNFQPTVASRRVGVSHKDVRKWAREEPAFAEMLKSLHQCKKDFYENALIELVKRGDSAAVIFVNKTYNKDRGYGGEEQQERTVRHEHRLILDDLPVDARRAVLDAIRKNRGELEYKGEITDAEVEQ